MTPHNIDLYEYQPCKVDRELIDPNSEAVLYDDYSDYLGITPPSYRTQNRWELTSQGYVGHIPLSRNLHLHLQPKIPIANIFGMWEYASHLKSFRILDGVTECEKFAEFYSQLAKILAERSLRHLRRGLYRTYVTHRDRLSVVRGRIDLRDTLKRPWEPRVTCNYPVLTADVPDNQILAWTLYLIARSDLPLHPNVVKAYRAYSQHVSLQPYTAADCCGRAYSRLNTDYQFLHSLCRFFLENTVPNTKSGDRLSFPFLVNMANLYEAFVAAWLTEHFPKRYRVETQKTHYLDGDRNFKYNIDIVIRDRQTRQVRYVLDTKYKVPEKPGTDDLQQIHSYARTQNCTEAALIYPQPLSVPYNNPIDSQTHVRTLTFDIGGNLDDAGKAFRDRLFESPSTLSDS